MMVMSHQYLLFEEVEAVKDWSTEMQHKLPLLRDVDSSYYLRQENLVSTLVPMSELVEPTGRNPTTQCRKILVFSCTLMIRSIGMVHRRCIS